jgi:hypothetical protein
MPLAGWGSGPRRSMARLQAKIPRKIMTILRSSGIVKLKKDKKDGIVEDDISPGTPG